MATIVPLSHSLRWRSRSSSADLLDAASVAAMSLSPPRSFESEDDAATDQHDREWDEEPSDDEDEEFDELQSSAWLVVPREYANPAARRREAPVSPHSGVLHNATKSMERRRADESSR